MLYHITSFNYSLNYVINKGKLPDVIASRVVHRHRPQNWIALSRPYDTLRRSWRITSVSAIAKSPAFWFRATRHSFEAIYFPRFLTSNCLRFPFSATTATPGNSYHVRAVNHQVPAGIVDFYKRILLRGQYSSAHASLLPRNVFKAHFDLYLTCHYSLHESIVYLSLETGRYCLSRLFFLFEKVLVRLKSTNFMHL